MNGLLLKEFAYQYILLHDNLTKDEQLQMGNFVKEASEEQVMALLLCGECKEKLGEGEGKFVRELFEVSPVGIMFSDQDLIYESLDMWVKSMARKWASYRVPGGEEKTLGDILGASGKRAEQLGQWRVSYKQATDALNKGIPIAATVVATLVILVSYKLYKTYLSKAAKACKGQATSELKKICLKKYKIEALKSQIKELTTGKSACKETKNPAKCAAKVDSKIHSIQVKLQKLSRKK